MRQRQGTSPFNRSQRSILYAIWLPISLANQARNTLKRRKHSSLLAVSAWLPTCYLTQTSRQLCMKCPRFCSRGTVILRKSKERNNALPQIASRPSNYIEKPVVCLQIVSNSLLLLQACGRNG